MRGLKGFKNFKERGEWVELRFMGEALRHGYKVLKPWGESAPFDVALYFGSRIVSVQVKSALPHFNPRGCPALVASFPTGRGF
jgi:hypothetical protein